MVSGRRLVVNAGFEGYLRPYQYALGDEYDYTCINSPEDAAQVPWEAVRAVVFTGGADIDPKFYGEEAGPYTYCDPWHDAIDEAVLDAVRVHPSIYKFGTCRGAQLLFSQYLGGKLIQDIPHHEKDHMAYILPYGMDKPEEDGGNPEDEDVTECVEEEIPINSLHHQAMIWDSINDTGRRTRYFNSESDWYRADDGMSPSLLLVGDSDGQTAVEAWQCEVNKCLGFQYHPEWMASDERGFQWTIAAIRTFMGIDHDAVEFQFPTDNWYEEDYF